MCFCKETDCGYSLMCNARKHIVGTHWCVLQEKILWVLIDSALQEKMLWVLFEVFCKKTDCGYSLMCFARKQILGTHRRVLQENR